jgi:hypothetical protein
VSTIALQSSFLDTSLAKAITSAPVAEIAFATACTASSLISLMTNLAPRLASSSASNLPKPCAAPVITATFPVKSNYGSILFPYST